MSAEAARDGVSERGDASGRETPERDRPMRGLKVLVVGAGGREHALVWAIRESASAGDVHAAPGNPGIGGDRRAARRRRRATWTDSSASPSRSVTTSW